MKCSYFLYSVLLLLVFGGCCKLDDSPLRLTATDKELLPNQVGDTVKLKDMATGIVYNYVVDSVDISLELTFEDLVFSANKSGCASKRREIEVGKTTFSGNGSYRFGRSDVGDFYFSLNLSNLSKKPFLFFSIIEGRNDQFLNFRDVITINQMTFKNVYEIFITFSDVNNYARILISQNEGLIYIDDRVNDVLLQKA